MDYDASDILGGGTLPVGRNQPPGLWSTIPDFAKKSLCTVCCLISILVVRDLYFRLLRWRERSYRKATRRRHGIPDSDQRPFNVAYAAAVNARQECEAQGKAGLKIWPITQQRSLTHYQPDSRRDRRDLITAVPGGLSPHQLRGQSVNLWSRHSVSAPGSYGHSDIPPIVVSSPVSGNNNLALNGATSFVNVSQTPNRSRKSSKTYTPSARPSKHGLDGDAYPETERDTNKKSRVGDEEDLMIQEDDDMEGIEYEAPSGPKRGSKRLASPDDDDTGGDLQTNRLEKRARKVSRDHTPEQLLDEHMGDVDILSDSAQSPRGKKRDRGDEGSTFGGDEDSFLGDSDEKHRRRRKRRTVSNKKHPRGQKRSRDLQTVESEGEEELGQSVVRRSRKKRGKQTVSSDDEDAYMDDALVSLDPLCKGRVIGEEWELGGTRYKVGPNGDRMRQTLVKRERPKYPMPIDSEHPDKDVMIEVIVETWLTEDEYRFAKERFELAWQDSPQNRPTPDPEAPLKVQTATKGGKNLLWSSTTSHPESPVPDRRPFRQSIATNIGLQLNPFHQSQYTGKGRITGAIYSPIAGSPDTPKLKHAKSYSKWEKQDLEAEAMSKIRQRLQEQKKVVEEQNKPATPQVSVPPPSVQPPPTTASTISGRSSDTKAAILSSSTLAPLEPAMKEPLEPFAFGPPAKDTIVPPLGSISSTCGKPPTSSATPNILAPSVPAPAPPIPNPFAPNPSSNTPVSAPVAPQPTAAPSSSSFGFPPVNNSTVAPKPLFSFPASSNTSFGASAGQPKKTEPNPTSTGGPSLLARVEQPVHSTTVPAPNSSPAVAESTNSPFSFGLSGAAPSSDTNKPKFAFGALNKSSSIAASPAIPATSAFGVMQTPQQPTLSTPLGGQAQLSAQNNQPKFGFGFAGSSQPKADTVTSSSTSTTPKPPSVFGGTPNVFQSTSSTSAFGGSGNTGPKPMETPKAAFNFGISPASSSTTAITTPSISSSTPFGNSAPSATPASNPFGANLIGMDKPVFSFGSGGSTPAAIPKPPFSFVSSNPTTPTSATPTDGQRGGFSFGTSNPSGVVAQQPLQSNPPFTFGNAKPSAPQFSFGTPSQAGTPAPAPSTFSFGKPEEKK